MTIGHIHISRYSIKALLMAVTVCAGCFYTHADAPEIYDIDAAIAYCDSVPLQSPEGIWIYPEDAVTVLITVRKLLSQSVLPTYDIRVIDTSDSRLRPGDILGILTATPENNKFEVQLFTERKNDLLLKPKTILAQLSNEGETMILKKEKSKISLRFSFNPSTLLPKMWRIIRLNTSTSGNASVNPVIGMIKIYPSYDGNGSSRRQIRYL